TVSLKTLGLLSLMGASGMHVPALPGTELAVFSEIFADIGDEQSIEQSLSTFSAHMKNIVKITKGSTSNSLVLFDEIGAGTDPQEGSALAKAIISYLLEKNCRLVATTHYSELKEYAYVIDGLENASVDFNIETLRPTYKLMVGIPGSSNAFSIALRLGLNPEIIESAKNNLGERAEITEELIKRIQDTHKEAQEKKLQAELMSKDVEELRKRYESKLKDINKVKGKVAKRTKKKAENLLENYTKRLEETLAKLETKHKDSSEAQTLRKQAENLLEKIESKTKEQEKEEEIKDEALPANFIIKPGVKVKIAEFNQDGEVVSHPDDEGNVVVLIGAMKFTVNVSSLRKSSSKSQLKTKTTSTVQSIGFEKAKYFNPEIMLRGMRVEPAIYELDKYIDDAIAAGAHSVRVIHGKGTGQMKKAVWEFLKNHKGVSSFKFAEQSDGGSGATIVFLK
ncbi:MAG: Smr/MutS family protein, partial [Armatimonadota bacterium]